MNRKSAEGPGRTLHGHRSRADGGQAEGRCAQERRCLEGDPCVESPVAGGAPADALASTPPRRDGAHRPAGLPLGGRDGCHAPALGQAVGPVARRVDLRGATAGRRREQRGRGAHGDRRGLPGTVGAAGPWRGPWAQGKGGSSSRDGACPCLRFIVRCSPHLARTAPGPPSSPGAAQTCAGAPPAAPPSTRLRGRGRVAGATISARGTSGALRSHPGACARTGVLA